MYSYSEYIIYYYLYYVIIYKLNLKKITSYFTLPTDGSFRQFSYYIKCLNLMWQGVFYELSAPTYIGYRALFEHFIKHLLFYLPMGHDILYLYNVLVYINNKYHDV